MEHEINEEKRKATKKVFSFGNSNNTNNTEDESFNESSEIF